MAKGKSNSDNHSRTIRPSFWLQPLPLFLILVLSVGGALGLGMFLGRQEGDLKSLPPSVSSCPPCATQNEASTKDKDYQEGYKSALEFARQKVADIIPGMEGGAHVLNGHIKSIQSSSVTVTLDSIQIDIFSEGAVDKVFMVTPDTLIEKSNDKLIGLQQKEIENPTVPSQISKATESQTAPPTIHNRPPTNTIPPQEPPHVIKKISVGNLKVGDLVELKTESDLNSPDPLVAASIRLVPQP
jgi:hypothetical protein